ncbi:MAG: DUF58 domain-containing protein [Phycisphaerae bacterium]
MILPTRKLLLLLALPAAILLVARGPGGLAIGLALDVTFVLLALLDWFWSPRLASLEIERAIPPFLSLDAWNEAGWDVRNGSGRTLSVALTDDVPDGMAVEPPLMAARLPAHTRATLRYRARPHARGLYEFGDIHVRCATVLGLLVRQQRIHLRTPVKVYPNVQNLRHYEMALQRHRMQALGLRRATERGQGHQFESLREYLPGDDVRDIAWKATARRSRLIVREFGAERSQNIVVMLDCGRLMTTQADGISRLDYAINATIMLTYAAMKEGDSLGLLGFSDEIEAYVPPTRGGGALRRMNEALYRLEARVRESNYDRACRFLALRHRKRSLIVLLTDVIDPVASATLLAHMGRFVRHHRPLCVTLQNRELERQVAAAPSTVDDCYVKAVAIQTRDERRLALERMRKSGVDVLDVDPRDLTPAVLSRYLALKRSGRF